MSEQKSLGLHWFRRDLRIAGNQALQWNWKKHNGCVLGIFCFDSIFLSRSDFSHHRFALFLKTLAALQNDLRATGGDLLVVDALPEEALPRVIQALRANYDVQTITWNRDYEPFARSRDQKCEALLQDLNLEIKTFRDHLILEPHEIYKTQPGDFYQVYSPFARKWFDHYHSDDIQKRLSAQKAGLQFLEKASAEPLFCLQWKDLQNVNLPYVDQLQTFVQKNNQSVTIPIPESGSREAFAQLQAFKEKMAVYKTQRDIPSQKGTSRLSVFLKNGSLTTSQIITYLGLHQKNEKTEDGPTRYLKELIWREFYYHILYHRPEVEKKAFLTKYENLNWENNQTWFQRWCEGTTGFPIVDAGMRELNTTGWMHNRVRMIVASFLCKDLLIDWRWGENYFMKMLLDGDMAPNNGGWQWAASTGCDPQPYFRIFNPWLQSAKFDPQAEYIKRYIPELRDCSPAEIHNEAGRESCAYPRPMVDHKIQKIKALALYKS